MRLTLALSAAGALLASAPLALAAQQPTPVPPARLTASPQTIPLDRGVAVVGDVVITQSDLTERIIRKRSEGVKLPSDSAGMYALARSAVDELVQEELLLGKAKDLKVE